MGLPLLAVPPRQGWRWISRAFGTWRQRPLAFVGLFVSFMLGVLLLMAIVPVVGGVVGLALVPMLSLGFMIATRSALAGGPVGVVQFADGLRTPDRARRAAQLKLCAGYAISSVLVIMLSDWVDGGSLDALMKAMSEATPGKPSPEVDALLADRQLAAGMLARFGLATLLSVPYWYAPALVHWGGQGAGQALFSSTVAVWRARGAFTVYALGWLGVMLAVSLLGVPALLLLGTPRLAGMMALPIALVLSAVFYVSLWFGYVDGFGEPDGPARPAA